MPNSHYIKRKEEYETWAMKMEYWIMNTDHNLWNIVLQGNSRKRTGRDLRGNIMILPPVTIEEQIAVQREIKARTILLQSLTEDPYVTDVPIILKDARNLLVAQWDDDRFQKVLSQLNQMQARPDNEDCNMKTLEIDVKGGSSYDSRVPAAPTHSAFISAASTNSKWSTADSKGQPSTVSYTTTSSSADASRQYGLKNFDIKLAYGNSFLFESIDVKRRLVKKSSLITKIAASLIRRKSSAINVFRRLDIAKNEQEEGDSKTRILGMILIIPTDSDGVVYQNLVLGYGNTLESDEVFDLSAPSIFDSCLKDAIEKPLYDWFVKPVGMHVVPPPITRTFMPPSNKPDIDDTQFTYGSKSNNCVETNSVSNDFVSCDNSDKSSDSESAGFASCASSVNSSSTMTNASSSVDLKNLYKTDDQGPSNDTQSPSFSFKKNNQLRLNKPIPSFVPRPAYVPAGSRNRPTSVPTGRPFPTGWHNPAARPMTRPKSHYFQQFSRPGSYNQMVMDGGRWGTAVKTSAGLAQNKVLFTDSECLVLSKEFKLPDSSQVVLRVPRRHNLIASDLAQILSRNESVDFISFVENQLTKKVKAIRCDNGTEFKNSSLIELCGSKGIKRDYSVARTPQQNGVAERKNRTLKSQARNYASDSKLPTMFWTEAVILLLFHHPALKPFGCHVTILNTSDHLGKFEGKADEGFLVGYSAHSKAYMTVILVFKSNPPQVPEVNLLLTLAIPATSIPAGSINQAAGVSAVPSTPSSSMVEPVHANDTPHFPLSLIGLKLENSTRFPSPSDLANHISSSSKMEGIHHHPTTGIFFESSYDADFGGSITNLAPYIDVDPAPTRRVHTSALAAISSQQRNNHTDYLHCLQQAPRPDVTLVYVDDPLFLAPTNKSLSDEFEVLMKGEFEMSAMGELTFFLGLQVLQKSNGIFISQDKYVQDMLTKFDMVNVRSATTPFEATNPKSKEEPDEAVNVHLYRSMIVLTINPVQAIIDSMVALKYRDKHNKVGFLEKSKGSTNYDQTVCISHEQVSTPPRPAPTNTDAQQNEQGPFSDPTSTQAHDSIPDPVPSTNVEDESLGGTFFATPSRSPAAPPKVCEQGKKIENLESELQAHKLLFKEVMGKLVKRVKFLESKLKARGRKVFVSESDNEEAEEQDSSVIYSTGWTLKHVKSFTDATLQEEFNKIRHAVENLQTQILRRSIKRPGADLDQPTSKKSKSNEAQNTSVPPASNPSTAGVPSNPSPFVDTPPHSPEVTPVSPPKPSAAAPSNAFITP
ncbi:putative ribonuclease H-like domain-containing protein [Tanacetum coccineum]